MVPPVASTPTRRREGGWRDPHHNSTSSAPYHHPYDYETMSPNPYNSNRGPPPPAPYHSHYDPQPPRGPPGPPTSDYWNAPPPYGSEHQYQHPPPHLSHRGGSGSYWGPPPPSPYDGYRGAPPRGPPQTHGHLPHPAQHQYRTPSRRPYGGEQQGGLELNARVTPSSPHRKDFSPPAPATAIGQTPMTRGVRLAVSASADSEETPSSNTPNTITPKKAGGGGSSGGEGPASDDDAGSKEGGKEKGDPLSVLADVSAGMGGKNKQGKQDGQAKITEVTTQTEETSETGARSSSKIASASCNTSRQTVPMPAPTSPLQRRLKPSPITPSQTPQVNNSNRKLTPGTGKHQPITPSRSHDTASTTEGRSQPLQAGWEPPPLPHGGSGASGGSGELYSSHHEYTSAATAPYNSPSRRHRPGMHYGGTGEFGPAFPSDSPALVERGSFDSHGDTSIYRGGAPLYPPSTPNSSRGAYFYDDHPPPPPGYGSGGWQYWEPGQPPYSPTHPPPSRVGSGWSQPNPSPSHSDPFYGPPPHHGPPPEYSYPPPPPHYGGPDDPPMYGGNPPPHLPYHHRGAPPPSIPGHHHPSMPMHPPHVGGPPPPYPYGHPPRMEEKTILRKKFSWKHYPELERFLIANRDEYLKHSNMNYTAEQKQYNNWLTERLLEVAGQHNYMFDPDDFNFVAIRDRIRCYYKSYVQTARKRGLKLPEKKGLKSKVAITTEVAKKE